jgi:hypothetical protein
MTRNQWPFLPRSEGLSLKTNSMASMSCGHVFLNDECLYVCIMYMRVYTYHNIYIYICTLYTCHNLSNLIEKWLTAVFASDFTVLFYRFGGLLYLATIVIPCYTDLYYYRVKYQLLWLLTRRVQVLESIWFCLKIEGNSLWLWIQTDGYIYIYTDLLDPKDIGYSLAKVANCNITIFKFGKS